jgi:CheY-like chemotaxis protein
MSPQNAACILLAEDNPADVMLVEHALKVHRINCKLVVISDGAEALRFFRDLDENLSSDAPDLVLLDLHLPKHGGEEIIQRLRASERCSGTRVVVMSSSDSPNDRADAERHSARYFRKPSGLDAFLELGTVVKQALAEQPLARRAAAK